MKGVIFLEKNKGKTPYLPHERQFDEPSETDLRSYSESDDYTTLPNPLTDPIVSNNISNAEFDYTEDSTIFDYIEDSPLL